MSRRNRGTDATDADVRYFFNAHARKRQPNDRVRSVRWQSGVGQVLAGQEPMDVVLRPTSGRGAPSTKVPLCLTLAHCRRAGVLRWTP